MASPTFSASLEAGRELFEKGAFHVAHEAWESGWRRTRGSERQVLQVLVLWTAGLHHHERGNLTGANRLLLRAMEKLGQLDETLDGLDLEGLREGLVTSLEHARHPWVPSARPAWPPSLVASMDAQLEHASRCPYCGEAVVVSCAPEEAGGASYVEDCPVCCRPWQVELVRDGDSVRVSLGRDDAQ